MFSPSLHRRLRLNKRLNKNSLKITLRLTLTEMQNLLVNNKSIKQQASVEHLRLGFSQSRLIVSGSAERIIPSESQRADVSRVLFLFSKTTKKIKCLVFRGYYHVVLIWCDIYLRFQSLRKGKVESRTAPHQHEE